MAKKSEKKVDVLEPPNEVLEPTSPPTPETVTVRLSSTSPVSALIHRAKRITKTDAVTISYTDYERLKDDYGLELIDNA